MSSFKPLVYFKPLVSMVKGMTFVCSLFAAERQRRRVQAFVIRRGGG